MARRGGPDGLCLSEWLDSNAPEWVQRLYEDEAEDLGIAHKAGRRSERAAVVEHLSTASMFAETRVIGATLRLAAEAIGAGEHIGEGT